MTHRPHGQKRSPRHLSDWRTGLSVVGILALLIAITLGSGCQSFSGGASDGSSNPGTSAEVAPGQNQSAELQSMNQALGGDADAALVEEDIAALQEDAALTADENQKLQALKISP